MVKWLSENDICNPNQNRNLRTHNYQIFRTTPLHAAIATYHDKLFYQKPEELSLLKEMIAVLTEKFVEKNGENFDVARNYKSEGTDGFAIRITFNALKNYREKASPEALAATKIQRTFRVSRLDGESTTAEAGRV